MIALLGDLHGNPAALLRAADFPGVTAIVQVGDFGLLADDVPRLDVPLYWIDGNHEYFPEFASHQDDDEPHQWSENCWFVPRGHTLTIGETRMLCLGGADSVDFHYRNTFEAERITGEQLCRALIADTPDMIVTHTPPESVIQRHFPGSGLAAFGLPLTWVSPSACAVEVLRAEHPEIPLYCGHMHRAVRDGNVRILDINEQCLVSGRQRR